MINNITRLAEKLAANFAVVEEISEIGTTRFYLYNRYGQRFERVNSRVIVQARRNGMLK